jgi:hypothetical protein
MKKGTNLPYIFAFFAAFLLALAAALAFADVTPPSHANDKARCMRVANNVALYAELRDAGATRDAVIDKQLTVANENEWTAADTLSAIYRIIYAYGNPDKTPEQLRVIAHDVCMKAAGYTDA